MAIDDLVGLAAFVEVAEAGGFSAAARRLNLSKSAVSKQVSRLENRLGARLLNRTTRQLSLTEVGADFLERAQRALAEVRAAEEAVSRLTERPRGRLRVNAPVSFAIRHLAPLLAAFQEDCPDLSVDLTLNDRRVDLVEEGYDVAIRIGRLADSSLVARRLAPVSHIICAAPSYLARAGRPSRPAELTGHRCLLYTYLDVGNRWVFEGPDGRESVTIDSALTANNGDALVAAAIGGSGIVGTPSFIAADALAAGQLEPLMPGYRLPEAAVHAVYPHHRHLSLKVRSFVDFLADRFRGTPPWERVIAATPAGRQEKGGDAEHVAPRGMTRQGPGEGAGSRAADHP